MIGNEIGVDGLVGLKGGSGVSIVLFLDMDIMIKERERSLEEIIEK